VLHLHPNAITILLGFAFAYEAFLGVEPSVALFRHFFGHRVTTRVQHTGCVSFCVTNGAKFISINWTKKVEGFRERWVYMDTRVVNPFFEVTTTPTKKSSG
jgi:hypothetical protein